MPSQPPTDNPAGMDTESLDADTLKAIRDLVGHLLRSMKTMRLYAQTNTMYQRALADTGTRLAAHVSEYGPLSLRIDRERMLAGGETVHQDDDPKEGLAFRLYSDGLRGLTFKSGLDEVEARTAMQIIAEGASLATGEDDDVITLLWNAELDHLLMDVVDDDPPQGELVPTHKIEKPDERPQKLAQLVKAQAEAPEPPKRVAYGADVLKVFTLTDRDGAYLDDLMRREQEVDPAQDLVSILSDVLTIEENPDEFADTVGLFGTLITDFLSQGNLPMAASLGRGLVSCVASRKDLTTAMKERAMKELLTLGGGKPLAALEEGLGLLFGTEDTEPTITSPAKREQTMSALNTYLTLLRTTNLRTYLELASRTSDGQVRDMLCDHAVRMVPESHDALTGLLLELNTQLVICATDVLGRVGNTSDLLHFGSLTKSPDVNVRRAALEAITSIAGGSHPQVIPYLADPDPRLRRRALGIIEKGQMTEAVGMLREIAADPGFGEWEIAERRAVFFALGSLGKDELVPMFNRKLQGVKRGLFGGTKGEDDALLAIMGLKGAATESARQALEAGKACPSEKVAAACSGALRDMTVVTGEKA
ncbi:MAG: HEAT repeat domain-containing protein [Nitrospirota bacterium]|nr:HEAT repeat domain-containing protein [Nitrospirota bacterium]